MDSSKIKKNITSITFDGKYTIIGFGQSFKPQGQNEIINEIVPFKSDMERHADFTRAMDKFKAHLILRSLPFVEFKDSLGKAIDKEWFDKHLYENDPRFMDVEVTSVIITTKKDVTGFQINGYTKTVDDQIVRLKSPVISTIRLAAGEGYNYPLLELADEHLDTVLLEAKEFLNYKSANGQLKLAIVA